MDTSTELFDSYEQDFKQIIESVRGKVEGDGKNERGGWCFVHLEPASNADVLVPAQSKGKLRCVE